jgi:hypothetical protein
LRTIAGERGCSRSAFGHIAPPQLVLEFADHRRRELRKPYVAEVRFNVEAEMLTVGFDR